MKQVSMAEILLREIRTKVDVRFVGIRPRGNKLKPVHMAGGEFRALQGKVYDTEKIKRISYVVSKKDIDTVNNYVEVVDASSDECYELKEDIERTSIDEILNINSSGHLVTKIDLML